MKRGIALISLVAVLIWFGLRGVSSTRPLLSPADFTAGGPDALEFCDPRNPRFLAVADKRSVVVMKGIGNGIWLNTASGNPIGPKDLKDGLLRIFAVNDDLSTYKSGAAAAAAAEGEWTFQYGGSTHLFADFTPLATGQEMYVAANVGKAETPVSGVAAADADRKSNLSAGTYAKADISLNTLPARIFARQPIEVLVQGTDPVGQAELAVFDVHVGGPTGFFVSSPERVNDRTERFRLTFPDAGKYVLWVQIGIGAEAKFRRFETEVSP